MTAEQRITGLIGDFKVSLRRPVFGHGLGTSREANANFRGEDLPSHNLYTEVAEELGYVGLMLLLALIWSFLRACRTAQQLLRAAPQDDARLRFLHTWPRRWSWWLRWICSLASPPSASPSRTGTSSAACQWSRRALR